MGAIRPILLVLVLLLCQAGCVRIALKASPSLVPRFSEALFEECDPDLAKEALPAELKLLEGLLKHDPANGRVLTSLSMGYTGYAFLFVEDDDAERASSLYLRARDFGLKALAPVGEHLKKSGQGPREISTRLSRIAEDRLEALFWTALSWNLWLNLNLDQPTALGEIGAARACAERVLEMDPDFFHGAPYVLKGTLLAAMPELLGGDKTLARKYFDAALRVSEGDFLLVHYFYARYYAVGVQDKDLFLRLLETIDSTPADRIKGLCLMNAAIKTKAEHLKAGVEDLFL